MNRSMKRVNRTTLGILLASTAVIFAVWIAGHKRVALAADPPRLNEVEVNTPSGITERCEYIEIVGTPGAAVGANTFFLSIDGDSGSFGFVDYIKDLSGVMFGANGTITIVNGQGTNCPNRTYPAGTTLVTSTSVAMGFGAETFLIATSSNPAQMFEGQDLDQNDDGMIDAQFGVTPIDGFGWTMDTSFNTVYGGVPNLTAAFMLTDVPDAATRFC